MANESNLTEIKDATANPAPLGLMGFGMTTVLLNIHNAGNIRPAMADKYADARLGIDRHFTRFFIDGNIGISGLIEQN